MKKKIRAEYILVAHCMDRETVDAGIAGMHHNNKDGVVYGITAIDPKLIREKGAENTRIFSRVFSDIAKGFRRKYGAMRK